MSNNEYYIPRPAHINKAIYDTAQSNYNTGIKYYNARNFKQAICHFQRALDHFIQYEGPCTEKIQNCYHRMVFTWWNLGKYEKACDDIGIAISMSSECSDIENIKALEGWMWHELIRSHKNVASQNPYYKHYLLSRAWWKKRDKRKVIDKHTCICGRREVDMKLHAHHQTYERVGKEKLSDLITLCKECHEQHHRRVDYSQTWPSHKPPANLTHFLQIPQTE